MLNDDFPKTFFTDCHSSRRHFEIDSDSVSFLLLNSYFGGAESKLFFSIRLNNRWCSTFHRLRLADKEGECSVETIPRRSYSRTSAETHTHF